MLETHIYALKQTGWKTRPMGSIKPSAHAESLDIHAHTESTDQCNYQTERKELHVFLASYELHSSETSALVQTYKYKKPMTIVPHWLLVYSH